MVVFDVVVVDAAGFADGDGYVDDDTYDNGGGFAGLVAIAMLPKMVHE